MKTWNRVRLCVEELEGRLVLSTLTYSTNWSGYVVNASARAVSQVAGTWVVPAVASNVSGYSTAWVGIDGWSSSTVEQIGTDSDYVNGQARYYAWYEFYPQGFVTLSMTVRRGDFISASVTASGSHQFTVSISDLSRGESFSITQTVSQAQQSSAEWIQEAPSSNSGVLPLANFGTINFSGMNATLSGTTGPADNSWSGSTLYQVDMVTKSGALKAQTLALSDSGSTSNFSVTWVSSGSSSRGGGHRTFNVPPPGSSQSALLLSPVTASSQGTTPTFAATQSPSATVGLPVVTAVPRLPASSAATATFAHSGLDRADPAGQAADEGTSPELPPMNGSAVPMDPDAASEPNQLPTPLPDQSPANLPEASPEMGGASDASWGDGFWLPAAVFEGGQGAISEGQEVWGFALAGLVLNLAVDRAWASASQEEKRLRRNKRTEMPPDGHD